MSEESNPIGSPLSEGDVIVVLSNGFEVRHTLSKDEAEMMNAVGPPWHALIVPAVFWDDPSARSLLAVLQDHDGPMHTEHLEHAWEQRERKEGREP